MSGARQSEWATQRRCQLLLLRLMRGPASRMELLKLEHEASDTDTHSLKALRSRLDKDVQRLRHAYGSDISCEHGFYTLEGLDDPLLDFPDEMIDALSLLLTTFQRDKAPFGREVTSFLQRVTSYLPSARRKEISHKRPSLDIDLAARDDDHISAEIWSALRRACGQYILEFEYQAAQRTGDDVRTHRVEPLRYYFDARKGHTYLEAFWLESRGEKVWYPNRLFCFRVGRMNHLVVMPQKFIPGSHRYKTWNIEYILSPDIARRGVTTHVPNSQKLPQPDGSVRVRAVSTNLFMDVRELMHYGAGCRIVGGEEALEAVREIVHQMQNLYFSE